MSTKLEVPCSGCSTDPCYHWPYCTELLSLRAENERLRATVLEYRGEIDAEHAEGTQLVAALEQIVRGWQVGLSAGDLHDIAEKALGRHNCH